MAFALAVIAGLAVALGAAHARATVNGWAGTWKSNVFGTMTLTQSGSSVSGTYTGSTWSRPGRLSGTLTFNQYAPDGDLAGKWTDSETFPDAASGTFSIHMGTNRLEFSGEHSREGLLWGNREGAAPPAAAAPAKTTAPQDTSPPVVRASAPAGFLKATAKITVKITLRDDSGQATPHGALYSGGAIVRVAGGARKAATGQTYEWVARLAADVKGPLAFCAWAVDAAGNRSAKAPRSSCKWISRVVDIDLVSNTCGGEGWESVVAAENYFGNTSGYVEDTSGHTYTVDFRDACNLHDAGYGGFTVHDKLNGRDIDFHNWTRKRVDDKFQSDMWLLCRKRIPPSAKTAVRTCIRDGRRYAIVRTSGSQFFDYDLMTPGTQGDGPRH